MPSTTDNTRHIVSIDLILTCAIAFCNDEKNIAWRRVNLPKSRVRINDLMRMALLLRALTRARYPENN